MVYLRQASVKNYRHPQVKYSQKYKSKSAKPMGSCTIISSPKGKILDGQAPTLV